MQSSADKYQYGWSDKVAYQHQIRGRLSEKIIEEISGQKKEPVWMRKKRLQAYKIYQSLPLPAIGPDLTAIDFEGLTYYANPKTKKVNTWADVPEEIKKTYEKIGVPQAERKFLAGVESQYDSEVIYGSLKKQLQRWGVIFLSMDEALQRYPDIIREYFGSLIPAQNNKFAALNSAVWSGGSFLYVPKGRKIKLPLQAYFRINLPKMGQFERTLIIAEEGSEVSYIEGCTAPVFSDFSLHAGVVEIIVKSGARVSYFTVQNWPDNIYNLVTKRARVEEEGVMRWVDGNIGSKATMKYPSCYLVGKGAKGEVTSLSVAKPGQYQDTGARCVHLAPYTISQITSKSVVSGSGQNNFRGMVEICQGAKGSTSHMRCETLLLDSQGRSEAYPQIKVSENDVKVTHEAVAGKIGEEQLFYLMSRGFDEKEAQSLIVNGFLEPVVNQLPFEYAVELKRLISDEHKI